jgi:predicted transcriptional regulator
MAAPKLSKLELKVMDALWQTGPASVREIQERFPEKNRPAYTTIQTVLYRLEGKDAVRRTRKVGNAHIFEAVFTRKAVRRRVVDELLGVFGGRAQPLVSHLIESGQLTLDDIDEARKTLRKLQKSEKPK